MPALTKKRFKGSFIKPCQGMSSYVCCGYRTLNAGLGCPMDCQYCILKEYLDDASAPVIFDNWEDIERELIQHDRSAPQRGRIVRLGSGELSDSLAFDAGSGFSIFMNNVLKRTPNILFEYKTKSIETGNLLKNPVENAVCSWSVNTERVIELFENKTPPLSARLDAARECAKAGYLLGFHFDPVFIYPGWEDEYFLTIERIRDQVPVSNIIWISMGFFRWPAGLKRRIVERTPDTRLFLGEFTMCPDGKMRYLRHDRASGYKMLLKALRNTAPHAFIYMCMESPWMWESVFGAKRMTTAKLTRIFDEHVWRFMGNRRGEKESGC